MKRELKYFEIEGAYGGSQDWFREPFMKLGGCGAETACDASIYMTLYKGLELYPFDSKFLTRQDYRRFGTMMRPYLSPRMSGIDRTGIFVEGFSGYMADRGEARVKMREVQGDAPFKEARKAIISQIDDGLPIAMLTLNHRNRRFSDYVWHWYTVNGYQRWEPSDGPVAGPGPWAGAGTGPQMGAEPAAGDFFIKAVSYGEWEWLDFSELWNTGYARRGGMVMYSLDI